MTGNLARLLSRSHPSALLVCQQTVLVLVAAASWQGSISQSSQPPPYFPSKKAGTESSCSWCSGGDGGGCGETHRWLCWLAGLVGRVRTLPLHVVIASHFHSFPSRRRSISGSPLPGPGWHFSLRGVTSCKVASLFQGFPIARIFPISAPAASHESSSGCFPVVVPLAPARDAVLVGARSDCWQSIIRQ